MRRWWTIVLVSILATSCGSDTGSTDLGAETTAPPQPSTTASTTTSTTSTTTTTTTTTAAPAVEKTRAESIAAIYRWSADLVEAQNDLNQQGAPAEQYLAVWQDATDYLESLIVPGDLDELHQGFLTLSTEMEAAWEQFGVAVESDPAKAQTDLLANLGAMGKEIAMLDTDLATAASSTLAEHDDAKSRFLSDVLEVQSLNAGVSEDVFAVFGMLTTDLDAAMGMLEDLVARFGDLESRWGALTPPDEVADLYSRQMDIVVRYPEVMNQFFEIYESGEEPSMLILLEIESLSREAAELNAAWSYAFAEHFESL